VLSACAHVSQKAGLSCCATRHYVELGARRLVSLGRTGHLTLDEREVIEVQLGVVLT